jgi:uncharacterized membrane protein YdbT with pleckstrin-like domain
MGFPQRLLADDERLVLVLRRHIKVIFAPILLLVLVLVLIGLSFLVHGGAQPVFSIAVAVVGLLIVLRWVLWPILIWLNTTYVITTHRLIMRTGVLNRSGRDMPLTRLNDVSFEHSLFERMLGCGTLMVESGGESGQLILTEIPKVELVQRTLYQLADDLRGVDGDQKIDPSLARTLDEAFDDEYRGPAVGGDRGDHEPNGRRS